MMASSVAVIRYGSTPISIRRVTVLGASLVCTVLNTTWPVSEAWMAICGGLQVADFADEDLVRVLPQDAAQTAREGDADVRVHLDLDDAVELVLDRVLGRDDLDVDRVDGVERGVERRGLAGSRWVRSRG